MWNDINPLSYFLLLFCWYYLIRYNFQLMVSCIKTKKTELKKVLSSCEVPSRVELLYTVLQTVT